MSIHFLLSAKARTLSSLQVANMTENEATSLFKYLRWGERDEDMVCPHCGVMHKPYFIKTRRLWKCAHCRSFFSVTSGTIFAYHKLPLKTYLYVISMYTNSVKGISSLQMAREITCQHKTAFVLLGKIREALMNARDDTPLEGDIHMDGAYACGSIRPENRKEDRVDRRLAENQNPGKRCILVMRQNYTAEEVMRIGAAGAKRSLTFIIKSENQKDIGKLAPQYIAKGSVISTDESEAYDKLHAKYKVKRVNHSVEYRSADGTTNNQAESFFSRFRRMQVGQIHKVTPKYLGDYANEIAFREDSRRWPNGAIFKTIAGNCAHSGVSRDWCGYWQGNHRQDELMAA